MTGWKISYFHFIYFVLARCSMISQSRWLVSIKSVSSYLQQLYEHNTQQQTPTKTTDDYQLPKFHGITKAKTLVNTSVCLLVWCFILLLHTQLSCATATIYCIYRSQDVIKWYSLRLVIYTRNCIEIVVSNLRGRILLSKVSNKVSEVSRSNPSSDSR